MTDPLQLSPVVMINRRSCAWSVCWGWSSSAVTSSRSRRRTRVVSRRPPLGAGGEYHPLDPGAHPRLARGSTTPRAGRQGARARAPAWRTTSRCSAGRPPGGGRGGRRPRRWPSTSPSSRRPTGHLPVFPKGSTEASRRSSTSRPARSSPTSRSCVPAPTASIVDPPDLRGRRRIGPRRHRHLRLVLDERLPGPWRTPDPGRTRPPLRLRNRSSGRPTRRGAAGRHRADPRRRLAQPGGRRHRAQSTATSSARS